MRLPGRRVGGVWVVVAVFAAALTTTLAVGGVRPTSAGTAACEPAAPVVAPLDAAPSAGFHEITPVRLLDTRDSGVKTGPGCTMVLDLGADPNVPDAAEALALNITTIEAPTRGFVTVFPCGSDRPQSSSVNPRPRDATASSVLVELDATRKVCLYTLTSLHLVVDMSGWFGRFGAPYHAVGTTRVLDTRTTLRPDGGTGSLRPRTELRLSVIGPSVPPEASAVAINVTTTDAIAAGFVTVYPCNVEPPATSTVNFLASDARANHALVGLGDGAVCIWSSVGVHVIIDLEGWFGGDPGSGTLFRPVVGSRVLDTRDGIGGIPGKIAGGSSISFDPAGKPRMALGDTVALSVVATEAVASGYVSLYPCGTDPPPTSAVNAVVGTEATNVAFVSLGNDSRVCLFASVDMHVVVDVVGSFGPGGPLRGLSISELPLGQSFSPDAHDYTAKCAATTNTMSIHAVGAPGTTVSIAPSAAASPVASGGVADQTLTLRENEAFIVRAAYPGSPPEEYWVRCLPRDFPVLQVQRTELPAPGWYLTDDAFPVPAAGTDQSRFVMILDNRSVPVWYQRVTDPSIDLTRMSDGTLAWTKLLGLAFGSTPGGAYGIHRLDGTLVRSISTTSGPTDHHDIAELSNGNVVLATYVPRQHVDLRALGGGYGSDELVYDNHLEEIRPDGTVAWTWKSEDHIPISATTYPQRFPGSAGLGVDLIHVNSIHPAPDGDLIVSARHTDTVYKIRRNTAGDVVLRVGGNQSDVTFVGDPLGGFARQHDAQLLANGDLRLFDNRTDKGAPRAVEYAIDTVRHTATLVWSAADPEITSSGGVGSVRGLGDGDLTVTWGGALLRTFTELGPDGRALQATTMVNRYPYRVDKQPITAFDIDVLRASAGH